MTINRFIVEAKKSKGLNFNNFSFSLTKVLIIVNFNQAENNFNVSH